MPTRYPNEGQPISILEAMGNGMFIITTDHAGIPDIVEDGVNGIVMGKNVNVTDRYEQLLSYQKEYIKSVARYNRNLCKHQYVQSVYVEAVGNIMKAV